MPYGKLCSSVLSLSEALHNYTHSLSMRNNASKNLKILEEGLFFTKNGKMRKIPEKSRKNHHIWKKKKKTYQKPEKS